MLDRRLKSATHQKTPTQNMKRREYNTDDRKRQGQQNRQAQVWTDTNKTQQCLYSTCHTARRLIKIGIQYHKFRACIYSSLNFFRQSGPFLKKVRPGVPDK